MPARRKLAQPITAPVSSPDAGVAGTAYDDPVNRIIFPATAESVLAGAWGGDMRDTINLFISACDTWDRLADNMRTVENALCSAPFEFQPAALPDGTVTDSAKEKAELVDFALKNLRPDPANREVGRDGLLKILARGSIVGHAVAEIVWHDRLQDWNGQQWILPRYAVNVGARWYGYPRIPGGLKFRNQLGAWENFPKLRFLPHVVSATDAHPSQAGRFRTLVKYWMANVYGFKWLMEFTQRFGTPFRWATYAERNAQVKTQLLNMLANLGSSGYGAFPEGTKLELLDAKNAGDLPQDLVIRMTNQACDIVIRGETASSGSEGAGGLGNTGAVFSGVRREAMQGYCNDAVVTLQKFAEYVIRANYGELTEVPTVVCEIPEPIDAKLNAERDRILIESGMEFPVKWWHERHDVPLPAEGETVVTRSVAPVQPLTASLTAAKAETQNEVLQRLVDAMLSAAVEDGAADAEDDMDEQETADRKEAA
jgi:phage gp29-like protein